MSVFNLEDFCATTSNNDENHHPWSHLHESSRQFLLALGLPSIHPFCHDNATSLFPPVEDVPPMGPLMVEDHHDSILDQVITFWYQASPALLAMGELWLRLYASALAPLGVAWLLWDEIMSYQKNSSSLQQPKWWMVTAVCLLSVASSVVLMTDELYVLQYGPKYGGMMLLISSVLSLRSLHRHGLRRLMVAVFLLLMLAIQLVWGAGGEFGGPDVPTGVEEGLYFSSQNSMVSKIASHWPLTSRTYTVENGATPWMPTGDSRTGLPFLLNFWHDPEFTRVWLPTVDDEVVALDICFPKENGHDPTKALYMVLHGLNGGSQEQYIVDLVHRRTQEGHTVVVMVARGLMDLPVRGWNVFHGARVDDAHTAATALRRGLLAPNQLLVGVGYSMGAIVLSNYVARSGKECALDAAMSVSGGLDMRNQLHFQRAKRLWQPMLAKEMRHEFIVGKFGERYRSRLDKQQMLELMRASHVSGIDEHAVVTYNGFDNITHYYSEMSAMGDYFGGDNVGRIANVSVPFCVLHALDDPLITWRTVADKEGMMHPSNLVQTGSGHLMLLLTKAGGHVGWPMGWLPHVDKWKWMSDAVGGYFDAVVQAKSQHS